MKQDSRDTSRKKIRTEVSQLAEKHDHLDIELP